MGSWLLVRVGAVVHLAFQGTSINWKCLPPVTRVVDLRLDRVAASSNLDVFSWVRADIFEVRFVFKEVSIQEVTRGESSVHFSRIARIWAAHRVVAGWPGRWIFIIPIRVALHIHPCCIFPVGVSFKGPSSFARVPLRLIQERPQITVPCVIKVAF